MKSSKRWRPNSTEAGSVVSWVCMCSFIELLGKGRGKVWMSIYYYFICMLQQTLFILKYLIFKKKPKGTKAQKTVLLQWQLKDSQNNNATGLLNLKFYIFTLFFLISWTVIIFHMLVRFFTRFYFDLFHLTNIQKKCSTTMMNLVSFFLYFRIWRLRM